MSFPGVPYRSMGKGLLSGADIREDSRITTAHSSVGESSQKAEHSLQAAQQAGECPFLVPLLNSEFTMHLLPSSPSVSQPPGYLPGWEGPSESCQFLELPETLEMLTS